MVYLVFFAVCLATFRVGYTEIQDVTSVFRLRETDVGDEFLTIDDCFGQTRFCPWYKSGWDVVNYKDTAVDKCRSNLILKHSLPVRKLSDWIPIRSNPSTLLTIKPKESIHAIRVYLSADDEDGEETSHSSMVMLTLSSDGNHQAYACLGGQQTGEKLLIHLSPTVKVPRKCSLIPDMFLPQDQPPTSTSSDPVVYEFEYSSETWELAVNATNQRNNNNIPECESEPLIRPGYNLPVPVKYLRLVSYDSEVSFSKGTPGLLLKDLYGEIVSRDIKVTPEASRLCLSISVTRNVFYTGLNVVVRASDGQKIDFESPDALGVDLSSSWRKVYVWNYVADLKDFENQTVDIQIIANSHKKSNFFISAITQCKGFGGEHQMTFIHQSATLEIHGNVNEDSAPFLLPNYRVLGPNVGVASDCVASENGCLEWTGLESPDWRKKSSAQEKNAAASPSLQIGLQRFFDSIGGVMESDFLSHQFVDGINILLHGDSEADAVHRYPKYFLTVLWDDINDLNDLNTSNIIVLKLKHLGAGEFSKPLLYKCVSESGTQSVTLMPDVTRNDCKLLQEGESGFTAVQELHLQIDVVEVNDGQEIQVFYYDDSNKDNKRNVLTYKDLLQINVTRYMLTSPQDDAAFATSYGVGSLFFSLEEKSSEVTSPYFNVPEDGKICLALDYFFEGPIDEIPYKVRIIGADVKESDISHSYAGNKPGKWIHATVRGQVNSKMEVQIKVSFTKQNAKLFLLQRLSFCHLEDNETAIYERSRGIPVSIFHPGARLAFTNQFRTILDEKVASLCRNGGELVGDSCDCPAGFNGTECENGCGPNRYGSHCQHICSYTSRGCRGMLMGRPYLGFNCAPGFGGPLCDTPCKTEGTYGAGCLQNCGQCSNNTNCDRFSGTCLHGCQPGWIPPQCKVEFVYLTTEPSVDDVTKDSAKLAIDLRNRTKGSGVRSWQVQYKLVDGVEWLDSGSTDPFTEDLGSVQYTLKGLLPGSQYQARFILLTKNPGQDYQGDKIIPVSFSTLCDEPTSNDYTLSTSQSPTAAELQVSWQYYPTAAGTCQIVAYEIHVKGGWRWNIYRYPVATLNGSEVIITDLLPRHTYQLQMRAITASKPAPFSPIVRATVLGSVKPAHVEDLRTLLLGRDLSILWRAPRFMGANVEIEISYEVKYQCIALLACPAAECPHAKSWWKINGTVTNLPINDLWAHARYRLWVRPIAKGESGDIFGEESSILVDTPAKATTARPGEVVQNLAINTDKSVTVSWGFPNVSDCPAMNGAFVSFHCQINPSPVVGPNHLDTARTFATFGGLNPSTEYEVKVFVRTSQGINKDSHINIRVKTHSPRPGKAGNLTIYSKGTSNEKATLSLRWTEPTEPSTVIDHYVVKYSKEGANFPPLQVNKNNKCTAWPERICFQITELEFSATYRVSVHAVSNDGKAGPTDITEANTNEGLPGKPSYLRKVSSTEESITFEVGIPEMLNGALDSLQVTATRIRRLDDTHHKLSKMFDVSTLGEQKSYTITLEKLKKNAKYSVHVRAFTMAGFGEEIAEDMETGK